MSIAAPELDADGLADLDGYRIEPAYFADVQLDRVNIEEEMGRIVARMARWNERLADAEEATSVAKATLKETEAELYLFYHQALTDAGYKVTERLIESKIQTDPRWRGASHHLVACESMRKRVEGRAHVMRAKKDMVWSLSAHIRAELGGDPQTRRLHQENAMRKKHEQEETEDGTRY